MDYFKKAMDPVEQCLRPEGTKRAASVNSKQAMGPASNCACLKLMIFRGNHLSDTTCLTHMFFDRGEKCSTTYCDP